MNIKKKDATHLNYDNISLSKCYQPTFLVSSKDLIRISTFLLLSFKVLRLYGHIVISKCLMVHTDVHSLYETT